VIDLIDKDSPVFNKQSNTRLVHYNKQKYNIQDFDVADYSVKKHFKYDDVDNIHLALTKKADPKKNKPKHQKKFKPINIDELDFID
jgi:hypothetical protein